MVFGKISPAKRHNSSYTCNKNGIFQKTLNILCIKHRIQSVLCKINPRRRRSKILEARFEVILAQLQGWERGAVLFVRPERTNATDEQKDEKGSLRRRLGRGSRMQAKDSAHVHSLSAATQKMVQDSRRGGLPAGRRPRKLAALGKEKKGLLELCSSQITESRVLV